jgi:ABC-type sugar transport system substrate-binding protein
MRTAQVLAVALGLLLLSSTAARAQTPAPTPSSLLFSLKPLGHNVWAAIDNAKGEAGANAGFVIGDNGSSLAPVASTFASPRATPAATPSF